MENMKNILLVFQHSVEFDFIRVILTTLGFNAISLHKSAENRTKLKGQPPDLVITASLTTKDETLVDLIQTRQSSGKPKFIWVASPQEFKKISKAQSQLVDFMLPTPIQPNKLIEATCKLLDVSAQEYVQKYQELQAKAPTQKSSDRILVTDKERKQRYDEVLTHVKSMDRVLNLREVNKRKQPNPQENSPELLEKKKVFLKALFGKK